MNKIISWSAVVLWMALIFCFSHQSASESSELSIGITEAIMEQVDKVTPNMEFNIGRFEHIVRKNAHFFIYFVLGMLVINTLRGFRANGYKRIGLALLISVLYAISDELHQLFVSGRGAQVTDVLIDSVGASVGIGMYIVIRLVVERRNNQTISRH